MSSSSESTEAVGEVTGCFWDVESSGQTISSGGIGMSTSQMKLKSTYESMGWDFDSIWDIDPDINDGYPYLRKRFE